MEGCGFRHWEVGHGGMCVQTLGGRSQQRHQCNCEMAKAKLDYLKNMLSNNSAMPQQLWKCITQILHRRPSLPTHASIKSLCDSF